MTKTDEAAEARSKKIIVGVVVVLFAGVAAFGYFRDQSIHGPFPADEEWGKSMREAQKLAPGAALVSLSATYVDEHGQIRASFDEDGYWHHAGYLTLFFSASPQETKRAPKPPPVLGAPASASDQDDRPMRCPRLRMTTGVQGSGKQASFGTEPRWRDPDKCTPPLATPLRCGVTDIWKRALADGAPHPAFADITLNASKDDEHKGQWHFEIVDRANSDKPVFERSYADDCPP